MPHKAKQECALWDRRKNRETRSNESTGGGKKMRLKG